MKNSFWSICTEAFYLHRSGNSARAQELFKNAEVALHQGLCDEISVEGRLAYLSKLQAYLYTLNTPSEVSAVPGMGGDAISQKLKVRIKALEEEKNELRKRIFSMPSIDPVCVADESIAPIPRKEKEDFGIILFGHTRLDSLGAVLDSLNRQNALQYTEVWLDGHQGNGGLKEKVEKTAEYVRKYPVKCLRTQAGNFGFRKMLLLGLLEMSSKYKDILILEDDCFPSQNAVAEFREELDHIRDNKDIFSVYGSHFLQESEKEICNRFQGWGWATTSKKLTPMLKQLIDCYSMSEARYLEFVRLVFTKEIRDRIDVTPPRQPSHTLEKFFAWDETLCLLAALNNQVHRPTRKRTIYNCGMGNDSTHFGVNDMFRKPPFNMITVDEVWRHY